MPKKALQFYSPLFLPRTDLFAQQKLILLTEANKKSVENISFLNFVGHEILRLMVGFLKINCYYFHAKGERPETALILCLLL